MATADLRPLDLGEILDRAVTLFVRRFSAIVTAIAVAYVPFAFVQWALGWLVLYKTRLTREEWSSFGLDVVLGVLVFALSRTAVAAIVGAAYMSRSLSLGAAYLLAARRFGAQIVVNIVTALIGGAILIVAAIPVIIMTIIATSGGSRGIVPILIALGIAGVVAIVLGAWLFLGYELATVRLAAHAQNGYTAVAAALRATVFRRPWRSLLAAGTLLLVQVGGALILSGIAELMPSPGLHAFMMFGVGSAGTILIEALTVTFLVVYDVDIAVRYEGLDLAVALEVTPPAPS